MGHPRLSAAQATRGGGLTPDPGHGPAQLAFGRRGQSAPEGTFTCAQVHGARVLAVAGDPPALTGTEGDALVTDRPGVAVGVRTADCLPVLLASADGRVVAAVHAGWRGTLAGVATAAVHTLAARYGTAPDTLTAWLGPCIRPCCYEVGPEVSAAVVEGYPDWASRVLTPGPKGRDHLDLAALNRLQLEAAGVAEVRDAGACTCCDTAYDSYRRDGAGSGRMVSWIRAVP
jgi:YfiH family protein